MRALQAQHGQQRMLNTEDPDQPGAIDGGYSWGRRAFVHPMMPGGQAMQLLNPMVKQLLGNTQNPNYSHRDALMQRFMQNSGAQ